MATTGLAGNQDGHHDGQSTLNGASLIIFAASITKNILTKVIFTTSV
jgi:hypothetical protein